MQGASASLDFAKQRILFYLKTKTLNTTVISLPFANSSSNQGQEDFQVSLIFDIIVLFSVF